MRLLKPLVPDRLLFERRQYLAYCFWRDNGFSMPCPHEVKIQVLLRNGGGDEATWIETGTFYGDTSHVLCSNSKMVYTIEPSPHLFQKVSERFSKVANVECLQGLSEEIMPSLLPRIEGDVSFWLDGHYSEGETFKGPIDTPIAAELDAIEPHLERWGRVSILVDDVRCFKSDSSTYPPLDYLVDWARKNGLHWHIEHDIFIALKR